MAQNQFIYGHHAVLTMMQQTPECIRSLYMQASGASSRIQPILQLAKEYNIKIQTLSREQLDALIPSGNHQGIIADCKELPASLPNDLPTLMQQLNEPAFLLILDGVQDPHNLGACLRSANAAGVHAVIAPKDRAVGITPVVRKVASGAAELTPFIQVTNLARTMKMLQDEGVWLFGAAEEGGEDLFSVDLSGPIAWVLGSEGQGLRQLTRQSCDRLVKIPTVGGISSLNVSVATGVCLFETLRQRMAGKK